MSNKVKELKKQDFTLKMKMNSGQIWRFREMGISSFVLRGRGFESQPNEINKFKHQAIHWVLSKKSFYMESLVQELFGNFPCCSVKYDFYIFNSCGIFNDQANRSQIIVKSPIRIPAFLYRD